MILLIQQKSVCQDSLADIVFGSRIRYYCPADLQDSHNERCVVRAVLPLLCVAVTC